MLLAVALVVRWRADRVAAHPAAMAFIAHAHLGR